MHIKVRCRAYFAKFVIKGRIVAGISVFVAENGAVDVFLMVLKSSSITF